MMIRPKTMTLNSPTRPVIAGMIVCSHCLPMMYTAAPAMAPQRLVAPPMTAMKKYSMLADRPNGVGFTKRIDSQGSVHGLAATDTQIFWADDLGVRSMNSDGSSPQTLFAAEDTNVFGIDNGLVIFGAVVDNGTWLAICEMWTNGLFPIEQFRIGGSSPVGLSWDNDNYYYSFKSGSIGSFSRWPGEGFTNLYSAPTGYTLEPGLDDWDGNLYFLRRNTATGKTDILRRSSNGAVTIQKTDVGTFYLRGLYVRSAYLFWSNTTGALKKASLP